MSGQVLGIDVGGTFTDLVVAGLDGGARVHKVLNRGSGAEAAVRGATELVGGSALASVVHGTTVATNAVLERKGAVTVLVTTQGFRDVLELQRQDRGDVWDLGWQRAAPLVPREHRVEVDERLAADGAVVRPLDVATATAAVLAAVDAAQAEAVAICLLHGYRNPVHEEQLAEALRAARPQLHVSESHQVAAQYREYDRMSTTAINAYLGPVVDRHLTRFDRGLRDAGFETEVLVMQSNGGIVPLPFAGRLAASLCLSGPAGGVLAAAELGRRSGVRDLICLDMGGTSTDVALILDGRAEVSHDSAIDGLPSVLPTFRIETVGAGGGSIIEIDEAGLLGVGPRSAGAEPGPACYGNGGILPTVTDAWCAIGVLREDRGADSYLAPERAAALTAGAAFAAQLDESVSEAYWQALRVTTSNMARAVRLVSVEQGHDPRLFTLVSYGGAGGLHAAYCADELGIQQVVLPPAPGVFSAFGMICADVTRAYVRTHIAPVDEQALAAVRALLDGLQLDAVREFAEFGLDRAPRTTASLDLRYAGQAHTVSVPFHDTEGPRDAISRFHDLHHARYGFSEPGTSVDVVNVRLEATVVREHPTLSGATTGEGARATATVYLGREVAATFVDRAALLPGHLLPGPAVIEEATSTTVVPQGWTAHSDEDGVLWLRRQ